MRRVRSIHSSLLILIAAGSSAAGPVSVSGIGVMPSGNGSFAVDLSSDGSVVVGVGRIGTLSFPVRAGDTGLETVGPWGHSAAAVSADGRVIVGTAQANMVNSVTQPFIVSTAGSLSKLGLLDGGTYSWATGVNVDGSVVVGYGDSASGRVGWRWTQAGGFQHLVAPGGIGSSWVSSRGVSANGSVVVGYGQATSAEALRPIRWTNGTPEWLQTGELSFGLAGGVSRNGQWVAGSLGDFASVWNPAGQPTVLGLLPGARFARAVAVDDSGTITIGHASSAPFQFTAWIHTPTDGMVTLAQFLERAGADLDGWMLTSATAISADGTIICGHGRYEFAPGQFRDEGFVAVIPGPTGIAPFIIVACLPLRRPRRRSPLTAISHCP